MSLKGILSQAEQDVLREERRILNALRASLIRFRRERREHDAAGAIDPADHIRRFSDESARSTARMRESVAPYTRFVRSEGEKLRETDARLVLLRADVARVRERVDALAAGLTFSANLRQGSSV